MNRRTKLIATQPQPVPSLAQLAGSLRRAVAARLMREFGLRVPPPLIRRVLDEAMEVAQAKLAHEPGGDGAAQAAR